MLDALEVCGAGGDGVPAIAADGECGVYVDRAGGGFGVGTEDAAGLRMGEQAGDLVLHKDAGVGKFADFGGKEVEQVPLGHKGDEVGGPGKRGEVRDEVAAVADGGDGVIELLMRKPEERVEQAELPHDAEGGSVNGVAAKVAVEVLMLFKHGDVDAPTGEEESKNDSGGAAADNADSGAERVFHAEDYTGRPRAGGTQEFAARGIN